MSNSVVIIGASHAAAQLCVSLRQGGWEGSVIIGGGYIGLETAASLRKQGLQVNVLEAMPRILQRVTAEALSTFYKRIHTEEGVTILENVMASEIQKSDTGLKVITSCDQNLNADMVIIGIGVIPNIELAQLQ